MSARHARPGILLTAFGSSDPEARQTYTRLEAAVRGRFPGLPVGWGFTSGFIRRRLRDQGEVLDSVPAALAALADQGVTHVAVQSLHVIAGSEFDQVKAQVAPFRDARLGFRQLTLGQPLFANRLAVRKAMQAMLAVAAPTRQDGDALILMGHGTTQHPGDLAYTAADAVLRDLDPRATLATLEGYPTLDDAIARCRDWGATAAQILPMVVVAGKHVTEDLCGDSPASWTSRLRAVGITPRPLPVGCGDHPALQAIWVDHLALAVDALECGVEF